MWKLADWFNPLFSASLGHRLTALLLVFTQMLGSGCIHTSTTDYKTVELPTNAASSAQINNDWEIKSLIYLPSKLPLSDFFSRLANGEFANAFKRIDLNYKGSNSKNEALQKILDDGIVPVYVEIKNTSQKSKFIYEKSFALANGKDQILAIDEREVPKEIRRLNPKAVAADAFNFGVVVIGMAAILVALVAVSAGCPGCNLWDLGRVGSGGSSPSSSTGNNEIFNPVTKTTKIDYKSYLLSARKIEPGKSEKGLLFFRLKSQVGLQDYQLKILPSAAASGMDHIGKDRILRNIHEDVRHMKFTEAKKSCPEGTHVPTVRELAKSTQTYGAMGLREVSETKADEVHQKFKLVKSINQDSEPDDFYVDFDGYKAPMGDFSLNWFWSSSVVADKSELAYTLSGFYGEIQETHKTDDNVAVLCFPN